MLASSQFYHVRERVYLTNLGRWLTRDPLEYFDGPHLYFFVGDLPLMGLDPFGLWSLWRWIYTNDGNANDDIYEAAKQAAADYIFDHSVIRGGYISIGNTVGNRSRRGVPSRLNNVAQVDWQGGVTWTIDDGWGLAGGIGRSKDSPFINGDRIDRPIIGGGVGASWSEGGGWKPGVGVGTVGGQVQPGDLGNASGLIGIDGEVCLGWSAGPVSCGFSLRLTYLDEWWFGFWDWAL